MAFQVKVPTVGESISEVTIANWTKKDGDIVKMDEVIAELESDKATFELPAPQAGVLKIVKQQGEVVPIGQVICEIDGVANAAASAPAAKAENKSATPATAPASQPMKATGGVKEMKVPAVGESITEVTLSTWLKKDGDFVKLDEVIAEIESDKATFELPAEANGILRIIAKEKQTLPIGGLICKIEITEGSPATTLVQTAATVAALPSTGMGYASGHPSPAAGKILDEKGIPVTQVAGSGVGGRITKDDAVKAQPAAKESKAATAPPALSPPVIATGVTRGQRREKMTSLRKTIARRLVAVKNETAMLTTNPRGVDTAMETSQ